MHGLRQTYHRFRKSFYTQPMVLRGDEPHVEAHFGPFGDSASIDVDRCTVCTKHTIGLDIVFHAPMVLLGDEAQLEARFSPCGDSANLDAR